MTCPHCSDECSITEPCECECHDQDTEAVVFENQIIEFERDQHFPDSAVIHKTRIMVTGRTADEAHKQFERVLARAQ